MLASRCRVATVHRAGDSIVALGTGIGVHTSLGRVAGVPGTQVPVVAVGSHTAHAHGVGAGIRCGAGIPVVASQGIRKIGAARGDVQSRLCRHSHRRSPHRSRLTGGRQARIALCASIAVVARRGVRSIEATAVRVTGIIGAGVAVVAIGSRTPHADRGRAGVARGAGISIGARCGVRRIHTTGLGIARVIRARIVVVAVDDGSTTHSGKAGICAGAGISIITGRSGESSEGTSCFHIAVG